MSVFRCVNSAPSYGCVMSRRRVRRESSHDARPCRGTATSSDPRAPPPRLGASAAFGSGCRVIRLRVQIGNQVGPLAAARQSREAHLGSRRTKFPGCEKRVEILDRPVAGFALHGGRIVEPACVPARGRPRRRGSGRRGSARPCRRYGRRRTSWPRPRPSPRWRSPAASRSARRRAGAAPPPAGVFSATTTSKPGFAGFTG